MRVLVGTSGFSYAAWKGAFYPADVPAGRWLRYYAERLPTVELNSSFYRVPSAQTLATWRAQVPDGFRFTLKAPQRITHRARLADAGEPVSFLEGRIAELGPTLGAVLYQLPPDLRKDVPRLSAFLEVLPPGSRAAFEFRHPSWFTDDVYRVLHARGAAMCVAESEALEVPLVPTAGWGYLRLRRREYPAAEMQAWAERILEQPWDEVFVFFKHEEEAAGPRLAAALAALLGARA